MAKVTVSVDGSSKTVEVKTGGKPEPVEPPVIKGRLKRWLAGVLPLLFVVWLLAGCGGSTPAVELSPSAVMTGHRVFAGLGTVAAPVVGEVFTTTNGTWKNSPTSFTYQWKRCNSAGESCSNISGATTNSYTVVTADEGHTLRSTVTAHNASGEASASSAATGVVGSSGTKECFGKEEACGYPSSTNEGPEGKGTAKCSSYSSAGATTITKTETIEHKNFTGEVVVDGGVTNVHLNEVCIQINGGEGEGSAAVILENGATGFHITNSVIRGLNTTSESIEEALRNNYSNTGAVAEHDLVENCAECLHQLWTLKYSYVDANGRANQVLNGKAHVEDWWLDNNGPIAENDTLYNPEPQTAVIFAESGNGPCENEEIVKNSLIAGGGFTFYICAHSSSKGTSSIDIEGNRFARCLGTPEEKKEAEGGHTCKGMTWPGGNDGHGFNPDSGYFGMVYEGEKGLYEKGVGWSKNVWDNNNATVGEEN